MPCRSSNKVSNLTHGLIGRKPGERTPLLSAADGHLPEPGADEFALAFALGVEIAALLRTFFADDTAQRGVFAAIKQIADRFAGNVSSMMMYEVARVMSERYQQPQVTRMLLLTGAVHRFAQLFSRPVRKEKLIAAVFVAIAAVLGIGFTIQCP
eukprot:TRINITY_DN360_c0_g2_i1.p1 TRINITY_DN360_c0_g2~~TRINITY_DN360_c0_g2_i1.p1  ORF type:complete len:154 (-),score=16.29 TRINITY_DN360_c0_g2_i1:464-925(-)